MKILFVGGGTLGPVTPLLATINALKKMRGDLKCEWVGTADGPERAFVEALDISFHILPVVKFPRYPSWCWLTFPFDWAHARIKAARLIARLRPSVIVTVGGFTAVPIVFAAAKKKISCVTHQLDLIPGLANKKIASLCTSVTTSFEYEIAPFGDRVSDERIATPTRFSSADLPSREEAVRSFDLHPDRHVVLIFGGGTGSQALNEMVARTADEWLEFSQIIHITGQGRGRPPRLPLPHDRNDRRADTGVRPYVVRDFLNASEMLRAYAAADLVICRVGIGALSEIAALKKAAILVAIPDSHQEANAKAFEEQSAAVIVAQSSTTFDEDLLATAKLLLKNMTLRREMGERAHKFFSTDDGTEFAKRILRIMNNEL